MGICQVARCRAWTCSRLLQRRCLADAGPESPRGRRGRVERQAVGLRRGVRAPAFRVRARSLAAGDGEGRDGSDRRLAARRRLGGRPGARPGRSGLGRAGEPRARLGRVRLRGRIRQADAVGQRRGDAGARELRRRQDAVPRARHRPRLGARRRRGRRADGAGPPSVPQGDFRGLRRRARSEAARQEEVVCGGSRDDRAADCGPRAGLRRARWGEREEARRTAGKRAAGSKRERLPRRVPSLGSDDAFLTARIGRR